MNSNSRKSVFQFQKSENIFKEYNETSKQLFYLCFKFEIEKHILASGSIKWIDHVANIPWYVIDCRRSYWRVGTNAKSIGNTKNLCTQI